MKQSYIIRCVVLVFLAFLVAGCGPVSSGSSFLPSNSQGGNSNPSPSLFPPATPPPIPVITTADALADSVELDWLDESNREDGFTIERDGIQIATTPRNISAWIDTNVQPGTTYCYAVRSYNAVGKSNASPLECATVPLFPLQWPLPVGFVDKCDMIRDGAVFEGKFYLAWFVADSLCIGPVKSYLSVFSSDKADAVEEARTELNIGFPSSIAIGDGTIYIGGTEGKFIHSGKLITLNLNDLTVKWELNLDELGGDFLKYPSGIRDTVVDQDSMFATGNIWEHQFLDVLTIRFDLNGNYIWSERWGTSCLDWGEYIIFAGDGIDVHAKAGQLCEILSPDIPAPDYQGDIVLHYAK